MEQHQLSRCGDVSILVIPSHMQNQILVLEHYNSHPVGGQR